MSELKEFYEGKSILVTGAAGSIGSDIVREVLKFKPKVVRALDVNENGLFNLQQELQSANLRPLVGNVREKERCKLAVETVDVVFHAAALKHVPLCEYNPFEAAKTNVIGTQNIIEVAMDEEVERVITISTDKAANPRSVMGATKLLAERLTTAANFYKGERRTTFSCVRFGNVLGSNGSVIPTFAKQIKSGGPVSVTHKDMTRFIMSISDAVTFILKAAQMAQGGEVFILKMPAIRIMDLAETMIEELAPKYGYTPDKIAVKIIGNRTCEKLHEEMLTEDETPLVYEKEGMFVMTSPFLAQGISTAQGSILRKYLSNNVRLLSKAEIKEILLKLGLI